MRTRALLPLLLLLSACPSRPAKTPASAPVSVPTTTPVAPAGGARQPAVAPGDPLYARVEGTSSKNDCQGDSDCHAGGCSGEVCSAEGSVTSSCEMADWPQRKAPSACGCVAGSCIWYLTAGAAAAPTGGAPQGTPCADGACAAGLTCVRYYGIAGPGGPAFTSCEIPCTDAACPAGQRCVTIADGPGRVCRP